MRGLTQEERIDYFEIFLPIIRMTSFQTLLAIANEDMVMRQLNIETAYLHGELQEVVH